MKKICLIDAEYNTCKYLASDQQCTASGNDCSMYEIAGSGDRLPQGTYIRKERWYEKYYK